MLRRICFAPSAVVACVAPIRHYRVMPHINYEIEELAETQRAGRWSVNNMGQHQAPYKKAEIVCDKLNYRERRRSGIMPEKSLIRKQSQFYQKDGHVCEPHYKTKIISFTVMSFDGHPFYFRMPPMPTVTLNSLIDGSSMCQGHGMYWSKCTNPDCLDKNHGDGCLVNVDIETLDLLPPPTRWEYNSLFAARKLDRPDVTFNTRFSCQITLTEEIDGALFALKQMFSNNLRATVCQWSATDDYAVVSQMRQRKVEPWAPLVEEPLTRDFPLTLDMLWSESYQDIMRHKVPNYIRTDGTRTRPDYWDNRSPSPH
jgi:hypothetical protein